MTKTLDDMTGDYIDSRDLRDRLTELEKYDASELDENDRDERDRLRAIDAEGTETFLDWADGVSLIPEDRFEDHARELADDIGAIDASASWPLMHIDWTAAANELRQDYSEIEIDGRTYLGR